MIALKFRLTAGSLLLFGFSVYFMTTKDDYHGITNKMRVEADAATTNKELHHIKSMMNVNYVDESNLNFCTEIRGKSIRGGDFFNAKAKSKETCCELCRKRPNCISWTFQKDGICWIKDTYEYRSLVVDAHCDSGILTHRINNTSLNLLCAHANHTLNERLNNEKKSINVIIAGLAYHINKTNAEEVFQTLEQFGNIFNDHRIVLYENDVPADGGFQAIAKKNPKWFVLSEELHVRAASHARSSRCGTGRFMLMSHFRNRLLDFVFETFTSEFQPFRADYIAFFDVDQTFSFDETSIVQFKARLEEYTPDSIDVLCINSQKNNVYYDALALLPCELSFYDRYFANNNLNRIHDAYDLRAKMKEIELYSNLSNIPLRIKSCFGGLAFYRMTALVESGCKYDPNSCFCEHFSLSTCLSQKGYDGQYIDLQNVVKIKF